MNTGVYGWNEEILETWRWFMWSIMARRQLIDASLDVKRWTDGVDCLL
jgi:hypothetical protein